MDIERQIMVIGPAGAGKSTFVIQWLHNYFVNDYDSTIEDTYRRRFAVNDTVLLLNIFDTAGYLEDEREGIPNAIMQLGSVYQADMHLVIIVYDITNRSTFERVPDYWYKIKEISDKKNEAHKPPVLLIGTKLDLKDKLQVNTAEGQQMARDLNEASFIELSSKTRENFDEAAAMILDELAMNNAARRLRPTIKVSPSPQSGRMSSLLKSPLFPDVTLTLDTCQWHVHKFILSARSKVFEEIFYDQSVKVVPVTCQNVSKDGVTAMLHYIYTGLVDFNPKTATEVETLSNEYKINMIGAIAADIAKKGTYSPTPESLNSRVKKLSADLSSFYTRSSSTDHPAYDVVLKIDQKPIYGSRALLALNSKYFLELFEKNQDKEILLDEPHLDFEALQRICTWIYTDQLSRTASVTADINLLILAEKLCLPISFSECLESNIATWMDNNRLENDQWLALLNKVNAEQLKSFVEWYAAVKYSVTSGIWSKINKKSRTHIKFLACEMGYYVSKQKKECIIL